jgi:hypothetical protein
MSRAVEASGASLDSLPYKTKSVERSIEDQGEDPDCQILESRLTWGSNESDISWEPGRGFSNASNLANGVGVACNKQVEGDPLPKRQRKMMIRQGSLCIELDRDPEIVSNSRPVGRSGKGKSMLNNNGQHAQAGKGNAGESRSLRVRPDTEC